MGDSLNPYSRSKYDQFNPQNKFSKTYSHGRHEDYSGEDENIETSHNDGFIVVQEGRQPPGLKSKLTSLNRSYPSLQGSNRGSIG